MYIANFILFKINGKLWSCGTLSLWDLFSDIVFGGKALFTIGTTLNGPIWYISVLLICYFIAFLLSKIYKKYNSRLIFTIPIIIGIMIRYANLNMVILNICVARRIYFIFYRNTFRRIF